MRLPGPQEVWVTEIGSLYRVLLLDGPPEDHDTKVVVRVEWNANDYTRDEWPTGSIRRFPLWAWHAHLEYVPAWNGVDVGV